MGVFLTLSFDSPFPIQIIAGFAYCFHPFTESYCVGVGSGSCVGPDLMYISVMLWVHCFTKHLERTVCVANPR